MSPGLLTAEPRLAPPRNELERRGPEEECAPEVSIRPLADLTAPDIANWQRLARVAAEPNPFQESSFVLPLAASGLVKESLFVVVVRDKARGEWLAACVFQACPPSFWRPLPHLRSLHSRYSFLDSPLVHRDHLADALRAALSALQLQRSWHGVRFRVQRANGAQSREWNHQARLLGVSTDHDSTWQRAATDLRAFSRDSLLGRCSRSRRKSLLRARRWLEDQGRVAHRLVWPASGDHPACHSFLELEALGWKGAERTALSSQPADSRFFREMVDRFAAEGRVIFGELRVGERLVASTCNLVSGTVVFAFKLGWNPAYAKGNPGHWAEIELASDLAGERPDLTRLDSCSQQGSYVESVSTHLENMESTVYVWSRRASALCELRRQIRRIRNGWTS
jgi:CelD/BcsL family acetyltransferase involved in cellulose biosynthesis